MIYDFDISRANLVLEALHALEERYIAIIQSAAKDDADTASDFGNDLTRLHILQEGFECKAVEAFGPHVTDLSDQLLTPATVPNGERRPR